MSLKITSPAFRYGEMIPKKFTCDGPDVSPQLAWTGAPVGTKSFALICDDPDSARAPWVHWVIFNLPADLAGLEEDVPKGKELETGGRQGKNDFGRFGYGGPCPGGLHRYYFKLHALDCMLDLEPGSTKEQLLRAMEGHILAQAELLGKYRRG